MRNHHKGRTWYIASIVIVIALLLPISTVLADSDIEYDDNGLTPTEQQAGDSGGGFGWNPLGWDWSGVGDFFGDLWDGFVDGLSSLWEGTVDFFSNLGEMISDLWNSLPDWAQDLIITIGLVIGVAIAAVLLVVAGVISVAVAIVAIVAAAIAGAIYYALYGGTDAFNWMHATAWIFGSALVAGLAAFAVTSIGLGTIWSGIQSFGAMLGSWIARGVSSAWGSLRSLGGAIWTGLRSAGSAIWSGLRSFGIAAWSSLRSLGGAIWTGLRSAGSAIWSGLRTAGGAIWTGLRTFGSWTWSFLKANAMAGVWSSLASLGINYIKYELGLQEFDPLAWVIDAGLAFGTGLIGGPVAGNIKAAFLSRSWGQLAGWVGGAGFLGGTGNYLLEYFTNGNWDLSKFIVGGSAAILASPIPASLSGLGSGFFGELLSGIGDFATKTGEEIFKWTYDNWLSGFFDFVLVVISL